MLLYSSFYHILLEEKEKVVVITFYITVASNLVNAEVCTVV